MTTQDYFFQIRSANDPNWYDWKWQFAHRITDAGHLSRVLPLTEEEKRDISCCLSRFRMAITPYYLSLIKSPDKNDPVRRQCVPSIP